MADYLCTISSKKKKLCKKKLSQIFQLALADIQFEYGKFIKFIKDFTGMVKIDSSNFLLNSVFVKKKKRLIKNTHLQYNIVDIFSFGVWEKFLFGILKIFFLYCYC